MLDEEEALAAVERAAREAAVAAISRQIEELTQRRAAVIELHGPELPELVRAHAGRKLSYPPWRPVRCMPARLAEATSKLFSQRSRSPCDAVPARALLTRDSPAGQEHRIGRLGPEAVDTCRGNVFVSGYGVRRSRWTISDRADCLTEGTSSSEERGNGRPPAVGEPTFALSILLTHRVLH
jgi:hypothetical protein